jgi:hypothetical protein
MQSVRIELDLGKHCIRTEIKRRYEEALGRYFRADEADRPRLEERIELLLRMLEGIDLARLRAAYPELAGGMQVKAYLAREEDGRVVLRAGSLEIECFPPERQW